MSTIFASLITMDHINLEKNVVFLESIGIDALHVDVMDGHFVPRYGIYPEIIQRISQVSNIPLDLDLLVDDPFFALDQFSNKGKIEYVRFHVESVIGNELRIIDKIHEMGAKAIASLNLSTSFSSIERLVKNDEIDGVMLMGIHPGVLIQEHRPKNILNDLDDLKNLLVNSKASKMIGLDGAVSFESVKSLFNAGINNFICGSSSIFKEVDFNNSEDEIFEKIKENLMKIKNLIS